MSAIIVVRHAQPADCMDGAASHWIDTELTPLGRRQAQAVADRLARELAPALERSLALDVGPAPEHGAALELGPAPRGAPSARCVLYSSDLRRAAQTAEPIGRALGVEVVPAPGLREFNNGIPSEKAMEDLCKYVGEPTPATRELLAAPAGETWPQFQQRVAGCMERITAGEERLVVVVAHYGAIGIILSWWLGLGLTAAGDTPVSFEAGLASIAVLTRRYNKPRIDRVNDAAHLREAGLDGHLPLVP